MNELIRIENQKIGGGFVQTVNARELHAFLEVKKDFSNWIKKQIERARLVEGRDDRHSARRFDIPMRLDTDRADAVGLVA